MAQAEPPHLEMGQQDPEDYHLDLDAGEEVDDFDFQLEGVYDKEGQYHSVDTGAGDTANTADFEIAFDEEETRDDHDHSDGAPAQPTEPAQDADGDAGTDYNDEIGYDEDDITDDFGNVETGEPASPDLEPSAGFSAEDQELNEHSIDADARVATAAEQQDALDHISGEGAQIPESTDLQDSYDQSFDMGAEAHVVEAGNGDVEELASGGLGQNGLLVEQDPEHLSDKDGGANAETARASSTDRSNDGHDHKGSLAEQETTLGLYLDEVVKGTNNTSDTSAEVPDIRVLYNEVDYSLFGSLTDDPDTYFLTDANELDGPLSDFLCSLREVIAHEISPHDELAIRIEPLTLEFGERSRKRFLRRSFREILDCYAALFANQAVDTPRLVLQLLVRHDCEERFVELLESTGISEGPSRVSGYSENLSEDMDERSSVNANEDEEFHESPEDEDEDLEQDQADGEEAPVAETTEDAEDQVRALEDLSAPGLQVGPDESYEIMGDESELQHDLSGLESREAAQPEHSGENNLEGNNQDLYYEEFDFSEVVADGEGEYAVETEDASGGPAGDLAANQSLEELGLSFDISEQAVEENDSHPLVDETNGASGVDGGEEIVAAAAATPVPGSSSNGKTAPFIFSASRFPLNNSPADRSLPSYDAVDDFIDYSEDEDASSCMSKLGDKRKRVLPAQPLSAKRIKAEDTQKEELLSEIGYSDDEDDTSLNFTPRSLGAARGTLSHSQQPGETRIVNVAGGLKLVNRHNEQRDDELQSQASDTGSLESWENFAAARSTGCVHSRNVSDFTAPLPFQQNADIFEHKDNGANLLLELDSALDTIHEQPANGDDADASIYHDTDISADLDESQDADLQQETTHAFPDNGDTTNSKNSWDETHAAAAETTSSNHTSATSTVNGDEIDYEDQEQDQHQDHPAESFVLDGEAEEDDGDEIDWGNDGDENQDEGQNTEQKSPALAPTPSSPLGKRSRADEAESSVDEADHKRRRT
ncbi:hypothetical protein B0T22DRAFT_7722 [Podospora appendiculata]|uniref:Uncharacterized protein n=1 Tax=Podospora appendiculata TaxID=314037 RepID=A0AAE0XFC0_9PEZI|nr:hypothetical protein B0T22DRAFT_7722 [Podospora appendiculata]